MTDKINRNIIDHKDPTTYLKNVCYGLNEEIIRKISKDKKEDSWVLQSRLEALKIFQKMPMPNFGPDLSKLDLNEINYYTPLGVDLDTNKNWDEVPSDIKNTFEKLGLPKAEKEILAGVGAQYESDVVYHSLKKEWEEQGVIFENFDIAIQKYPEIVKKYFTKCISVLDHKFAALHLAVFSGGTFLYVPSGVKIDVPVQAYFRMNAPGVGQFEHTLIILEDNAEVHYIEGCSAPKHSINSLHVGSVEIFVGKNASMRYSSVENWSKNTYNLNTKRAIVEEEGKMEWISGNLGSGVTMLYPCSILKGSGASAEHLGIAFANQGQVQDMGSKVIHAASNTNSIIISKNISKGGGKSTYRGLLSIASSAKNCSSKVDCDSLLLDDESVSDTIPIMNIDNDEVSISHEAMTGKLNEEDIFYLMSRGLTQKEAENLIVTGFLSPIVKALPLEYALELNRLIEMEFENSIA